MSGSNYVYLDGSAGTYISTTGAPLGASATNLVTVRCRFLPDDYTPVTNQTLMDATTQRRRLMLFADGTLRFRVEVNGGTAAEAFSTVAVPTSAIWVQAIYDPAAGTMDFDTSTTDTMDDTAPSWSDLGTQVTGLATGTTDGGSTAVSLGASIGGTTLFTGRFYRFVLLSGATRVFDYDVFRRGSAAFTGPQSNVFTAGAGVAYTDTAQPHTAMLMGIGT